MATTRQKTAAPVTKNAEKVWQFRYSEDTKLALKTVLSNAIDMIDNAALSDIHDIGILTGHLVDIVGASMSDEPLDGCDAEQDIHAAMDGTYINRDVCALLQKNDHGIPWRRIVPDYMWAEEPE